jgi:exopolyphosphatase/guanosine-5'-triphosphate,3'-diphosphate pyrophosphatase
MQPDEAKKENQSAPGGRPPTTKVAALDLGSKTFKAVLGEIRGQRIVTRRLGKRQVGLGMDVTKTRGVISQEKLTVARNTLADLKSICEREGSTEILAVATGAVRTARNSEAILDAARELGLAVEIASGEREAELAYLAVTGGEPGKLVCDLGSHSMQLAWQASGQIESISIAMGYERAYPDFIRDAPDFTQARDTYAAFLDDRVQKPQARNNALIGLSMNSMASFVTGKQKAQVTDRYLSHAGILEKMRTLTALSKTEFTSLRESIPKANKILSSLILLDHLLDRTGHERAFIAESELPVGLIVEHFRLRKCPPSRISKQGPGAN